MIPVRGLFVAIAGLGFASAVDAQSYPSRPITIVVPLPPGTGMDVVARAYGERLAQRLGKPVVVENKPSTGQIVAANQLLAAPADGHTLAVLTNGGLSIAPAVFRKLPFDPLRDFTPISLYLKSPFILVAGAAAPYRTVDEFLRHAREAPHPVTFSSPGPASPQQLTAEMVARRFDLKLTHVPYKSSTQAILDVSSGQIGFGFVEAGASIPLIRDGRLVPLAVSSTTRLPLLPQVPTLTQATGADLEMVGWHMLMAKAGTPRGIVDRLTEEMGAIMKAADLRDRIGALGLIPIDSPSREGMTEHVKSELARLRELVESAGLAGSQ